MKTAIACLTASCSLALLALPIGAQGQRAAAGEVHTLPVQGQVYMLVTTGVAGGNVTLQVGEDGVLLVDTSVSQVTNQLVAEIRKLSDKPIRYIVNTHVHADHVGGNEALAKMGSTIAGGNVGIGAGEGAGVIAHENVMTRMSAPTGSAAPMPFAAWPTDTYFTAKKELFFNGEAIEIEHQPSAHTDGDSLIFFRRSDVVATGDLFSTTTYPIVDIARGGNIQGVVAGLNRILDITIPRDKQEGGTYVIPGHGRLCDEADVLEYRDMVTIIRDRVQDAIKRGLTLEQVKAARLTKDYDTRYDVPTWTKDQFVEAVYRSLTAKK